MKMTRRRFIQGVLALWVATKIPSSLKALAKSHEFDPKMDYGNAIAVRLEDPKEFLKSPRLADAIRILKTNANQFLPSGTPYEIRISISDRWLDMKTCGVAWYYGGESQRARRFSTVDISYDQSMGNYVSGGHFAE